MVFDYTENKSKSLLESFSVNNAKTQINESGSYDSDLALSNGILMVTILEGLKATGLIDDYSEIADQVKASV